MKMKKRTILLGFSLLLVSLVLTSVSAFGASVHVPEKYTSVSAGERFYFTLDIKYPENLERKDIILEYKIKDGEEIVAEAKVVKAVETQISFMDFIVIPENADSCNCNIVVKIKDYEGTLDEEVYTSFSVQSGETEKIIMYFFIILGAVILLDY